MLKQRLRIPLFVFLLTGALAGCSFQDGTTALTSQHDDHPNVQNALKLIEIAPDSPVGHIQLASAYIRRGRETGDLEFTTKGMNAVDRALELDATSIPARKLKATLLLSDHRFADALKVAEGLRDELPADPFVYSLLTDANNELGNYEKGAEAAQQAVDLKPNASSYARVAYVRGLHGDMKGAIEAYTISARITDPADREGQSWCLVQIGNVYWANGQYEKAERSYDEALTNFPDYYLALAGKGRVRASVGDLVQAASFLSRAQARHLNLDTILLLGDVYARLGDQEKALEQYALAEGGEATLGSADDPHRIALFWADRGVRLDDALRIAEEDYVSQKDIHASDTLAWCLYKKGRLEEARKFSAEARRLGTRDARILYHAGMIESGLGNTSEAKRLLRSALELNPVFDLRESEAAQAVLREIG